MSKQMVFARFYNRHFLQRRGRRISDTKKPNK